MGRISGPGQFRPPVRISSSSDVLGINTSKPPRIFAGSPQLQRATEYAGGLECQSGGEREGDPPIDQTFASPPLA